MAVAQVAPPLTMPRKIPELAASGFCWSACRPSLLGRQEQQASCKRPAPGRPALNPRQLHQLRAHLARTPREHTMQRSEWAGAMGPTDARLKALAWAPASAPSLAAANPHVRLPALAAALSPRDPVRVEWAPEAAVEFSGSSQKQAAAKPAVALTADASAPSRAAAASSQAILERRRKHVGPNLVRRGRCMGGMALR